MSANILSNIAPNFFLHLTNEKQSQLASSLLTSSLLYEMTEENSGDGFSNSTSEESLNGSIVDAISAVKVTSFVDGRGLACPQPLLKAKVALRSIKDGEAVYLVATDSNSQYDIQAYANHTNLALNVCLGEHEGKEVWHFLLRSF